MNKKTIIFVCMSLLITFKGLTAKILYGNLPEIYIPTELQTYNVAKNTEAELMLNDGTNLPVVIDIVESGDWQDKVTFKLPKLDIETLAVLKLSRYVPRKDITVIEKYPLLIKSDDSSNKLVDTLVVDDRMNYYRNSFVNAKRNFTDLLEDFDAGRAQLMDLQISSDSIFSAPQLLTSAHNVNSKFINDSKPLVLRKNQLQSDLNKLSTDFKVLDQHLANPETYLYKYENTSFQELKDQLATLKATNRNNNLTNKQLMDDLIIENPEGSPMSSVVLDKVKDLMNNIANNYIVHGELNDLNQRLDKLIARKNKRKTYYQLLSFSNYISKWTASDYFEFPASTYIDKTGYLTLPAEIDYIYGDHPYDTYRLNSAADLSPGSVNEYTFFTGAQLAIGKNKYACYGFTDHRLGKMKLYYANDTTNSNILHCNNVRFKARSWSLTVLDKSKYKAFDQINIDDFTELKLTIFKYDIHPLKTFEVIETDAGVLANILFTETAAVKEDM
jgi:hypothetical protein